MKKEINEIFIDEKGVRWKTIKEIPCPRKLKPRTQTFKISFAIEYELELTEEQIPHSHIIREKENCENKRPIDLYLFGGRKDFGQRNCLRMQAITKPNINVNQTALVKKIENTFSENYSFQDKEFCRINSWVFQNEIEYLEKNLPNQLEDIFLKLWKEQKEEYSSNREKAISSLLKREAKNLRKRLKTKPKTPGKDEYKKFIKNCCDKIKILKRNHQKINRKNIASKLHSINLNSSQKLFSRDLQKFSLNFEDLLFECDEMDKILTRK